MNRFRVSLGEVIVGRLARLAGGGGWQFRFEDAYLADARRPVLGQTFEDDPGRPRRARMRLPAFFSNLLPEGALRALVTPQADRKLFHEDSSGRDEPEILARLGRDLPGAVVVTSEEGAEIEDPAVARQEDERSESPEPPWKFSLAGVQLKFSPLRQDRRLTIPVGGVGGDWILKLPSLAHPALPANELSVLLWAREAGIEVPPCELAGRPAGGGQAEMESPVGCSHRPGLPGTPARRGDTTGHRPCFSASKDECGSRAPRRRPGAARLRARAGPLAAPGRAGGASRAHGGGLAQR